MAQNLFPRTSSHRLAPGERLRFEPLSPHIGADLIDWDVQDLLGNDWATFQLKQAVSEHLVVRLRGQKLDPESIGRVAQLWGPLMDVRQVGNGARHIPGHDSIKVISNARDATGQRLGDGNAAGQIWHVDASYWEAPPGVTVFYARTVPSVPPRTFFMNMIKVYAALPEETKQRIRQVRVQHHQYPRGVEEGTHRNGPSLPLEKRSMGAVHPLVRRHLGTHQPLLFLPFRRDCLVPGMSEAEGRALLEELWDFTERSPYFFGAALEPDDLIVWDNAAIVHRRESWAESDARVMWHLTAFGEVPTPMYPPHVVNINALGYDGTGDKTYIEGAAVSDY